MTRVPPSTGAAPGVAVHLVALGEDAAGPDLTRAEGVLSPAELARSRRATATVRRRRVLQRAALRRALAVALDVDPSSVPLTEGPTGRPELPPGTGLDASTSASGDLGLVAIARGARIGVDLERVRPWSDDVLDERWLSADECSGLRALPEHARAVAAARAWTQKEAVLKGRGTGLGEDPARVPTVIGRTDGMVAGWQVHDVPVPRGWVATVALTPLLQGRSTQEWTRRCPNR